jgi:hypothetical protein
MLFGLGGVVIAASFFSAEIAIYGVLIAGAVDGLVKGVSAGAMGLLYKDVTLWILILVWAFRGLNTGRLNSLRHPVILPLVLFGLYCGAELFNCTTLQLTVGLAGLRSWLIWLPLVLIAYDLFTERTQIERLIMFILLVTVPSSLYGAYQYNRGYGHLKELSPTFAYTDRFTSGQTVRAMSTFVHPSTFGASMALAALLLIGGVSFSRSGTLWKLMLLGGAGVCIIGMIASGSRTALVAIIPAGLMMMLFRRSGRAFALVALVALMGILAISHVFRTPSQLRYSKVPVSRQEIYARIAHPFEAGFANAMAHPLGVGIATGIGLGRGAQLMGGEETEVSTETQAWVEGEYGRALKELGIPGFIIYISLLFSCLRWSFHSYRRIVSPSYRSLAAALFAVMAAGLFMQTSGSTLYQAPTGPIFWICTGILMKLYLIEAAERRSAEAWASAHGGPVEEETTVGTSASDALR